MSGYSNFIFKYTYTFSRKIGYAISIGQHSGWQSAAVIYNRALVSRVLHRLLSLSLVLFPFFFSLSLSPFLSLSLYQRTASRHAWRKSDFSRKLIKCRPVIRYNVRQPSTSTLGASKRFQRVQLREAVRTIFFHGQPYVSLLKKERGRRENNDHALERPREHRTRVRGSPRWLVQLSREMNTHGPFNSDHSTRRTTNEPSTFAGYLVEDFKYVRNVNLSITDSIVTSKSRHLYIFLLIFYSIIYY